MSKQPGSFRGISWIKEGRFSYPKHGTCVHYEPAIVCEKGKNGKNKRARSYLVNRGTEKEGVCYCEACGMYIEGEQRNKIEKIVEYLNAGGNDDQKLSAMFYGVEIGEIMQISPRKAILKCGALCSEEYVPPKNIYL